MIKYTLKLWTSNAPHFFEQAQALHQSGKIAGVEILYHPAVPVDDGALNLLQGLPVTIHAPNSHGFHDFLLMEEQLRIWSQVTRLADRFGSDVIVVHPGRAPHTFETSMREFAKINDARIRVENMPGQDSSGREMFGQKLEDLERIRETRQICFDFEKAVKAAANQGIDHRTYIEGCIHALTPTYFHLSGGDQGHSRDQHENLWDGNFDLGFVKQRLEQLSATQDVRLVFETPRIGHDFENDLKNMDFFRSMELRDSRLTLEPGSVSVRQTKHERE